MKRIFSVSFTRQGAALQEKLGAFFTSREMECRAFAKYPVGKCLFLEDSLRDFTEKAFSEAEGILFIGAAGIAVRAVAPFVRKKDKDPAVLVLDDTGKYVIPILSGHLGGANDLSERIAAFLGAEAVITTSTDCNSLFSVDLFAVKQDAFTVEIDRIKAISSEILKGHPVGFQSDYPVEGKLPPELTEGKNPPVGILISDDREKSTFKTTLHLVPRRIVLGVGCRKNIEYKLLYCQIMSVLCEHNLTMEQVFLLASVDLKREEPALLRLQKEFKLGFRTFPADTLRELEGNFIPSKFVEAQIGVDNVCERAAWLAALEEEETSRWEKAVASVGDAGNEETSCREKAAALDGDDGNEETAGASAQTEGIGTEVSETGRWGAEQKRPCGGASNRIAGGGDGSAAAKHREAGEGNSPPVLAFKKSQNTASEQLLGADADSRGTGGEFPRFLFRKTAGNGVTVAAVELDWRCRFE